MKKYSERENMLEQIAIASEELRIAEQHFDYAAPEYIEIAIEEVKIAKQVINLLYKKAKLMGM